MSDPNLQSLPGTLDAVWTLLETARGSDRYVTLATVGLTGGAEARMVVLRKADRAAATLEVHTDMRSAKIAEIAANPKATLLMWDDGAQLQIRIRAKLHLLPEPDRRARWPDVPLTSRRGYGSVPPPGTSLSDPAQLDVVPEFSNFAPVVAVVTAIETLVLDPVLHRRAVFDTRDGFSGAWCAP